MWRTPANESRYSFYRSGWVNPESERTTEIKFPPWVGFEPTTSWSTVQRVTTELSPLSITRIQCIQFQLETTKKANTVIIVSIWLILNVLNYLIMTLSIIPIKMNASCLTEIRLNASWRFFKLFISTSSKHVDILSLQIVEQNVPFSQHTLSSLVRSLGSRLCSFVCPLGICDSGSLFVRSVVAPVRLLVR